MFCDGESESPGESVLARDFERRQNGLSDMSRVIDDLGDVDGADYCIDLDRIVLLFKQALDDGEQEFFGMLSLELVCDYRDALGCTSSHHRGVISAQLRELFPHHGLLFIIQLWVDVSIEEAGGNPHGKKISFSLSFEHWEIGLFNCLKVKKLTDFPHGADGLVPNYLIVITNHYLEGLT